MGPPLCRTQERHFLVSSSRSPPISREDSRDVWNPHYWPNSIISVCCQNVELFGTYLTKCKPLTVPVSVSWFLLSVKSDKGELGYKATFVIKQLCESESEIVQLSGQNGILQLGGHVCVLSSIFWGHLNVEPAPLHSEKLGEVAFAPAKSAWCTQRGAPGPSDWLIGRRNPSLTLYFILFF